ncbi:MAG TPA: helix-turn-helix domain-containing protein [Actinospica sp.]|nr:helix-turn-helix domain-containing protein [Actinospica sp.]
MTTPHQGTTQVTFGGLLDFSDVAFLTVSEVAEILRVSKMTVYRMVHSGELQATRVGRGFRVPSKAVRGYLAGADYQAS